MQQQSATIFRPPNPAQPEAAAYPLPRAAAPRRSPDTERTPRVRLRLSGFRFRPDRTSISGFQDCESLPDFRGVHGLQIGLLRVSLGAVNGFVRDQRFKADFQLCDCGFHLVCLSWLRRLPAPNGEQGGAANGRQRLARKFTSSPPVAGLGRWNYTSSVRPWHVIVGHCGNGGSPMYGSRV